MGPEAQKYLPIHTVVASVGRDEQEENGKPPTLEKMDLKPYSDEVRVFPMPVRQPYEPNVEIFDL